MISILSSIGSQVKLSAASPPIIKAIQTELVRLRYLTNGHEIDGIPGPRTLKAFGQFKQDNFLGEHDLIGPTTAHRLLAAQPAPIFGPTDDHIRLILTECKSQGINNPNQLAYVLATVRHETAHTYRPIDEYGGPRTRYAPYWGRGYVQLTWLSNYQKYSRLTGKDLVNQPQLAKEPLTAAFILVHGFRTGGFTGKKLSDYIYASQCDFKNARRCINGTDKADLIASYARLWLPRLGNYA